MSHAEYTARATGWVAGRRVKKGEIVTLTPEQAKYEPVDRIDLALSVQGADLEVIAIRQIDGATAPVVVGIDLASGPDVTVTAEVMPPAEPVAKIDMPPPAKPARPRRKGAK